jgi:hypothetical protein
MGPFLFGALWSTMRDEFGWRGTLRLLAVVDLLLLLGSGLFFSLPPAGPERGPAAVADAVANPESAAGPAQEAAAASPGSGIREVWRQRPIKRLCLTMVVWCSYPWAVESFSAHVHWHVLNHSYDRMYL